MTSSRSPSPESNGGSIIPPYDQEAEKAVLGCIMLSPLECAPACVTGIGSDHTAFYDLRHQTIYGCLVEMYDAHQAIDLITLSDWLRFQVKLDAAGGLSYLASLPDGVPSAANLPSYLEILMEKAKSRKGIRIATDVVTGFYEGNTEVDELVDSASQRFLDLAAARQAEKELLINELVHESLTEIEAWHANQGDVTGIGTGLVDLDRLTTGWHGGELIVIAGRPGHGKTSLGMNMVEHAAVDLGLAVGVFSLEMTGRSLVTRMICSRARVNIRRIKEGFMAERDFPKLTAAAARISASRIFINDISGLSILGLRTRARRMAQLHGIKMLVVDYLQLMIAERGKNDSRQNEVAAISGGLKGLAKELDIPVIAMCQLNRSQEKEKNRPPMLSDLRESGAIEQDADVVGLLHKPSGYDNEERAYVEADEINLHIAKQRNGPTGVVNLLFFKGFTRFESAAKVTSVDAPVPDTAMPYAGDTEPQQEMPI